MILQGQLLKSLMMKKHNTNNSKKKEIDLNETNLSEQLSKFFPSINDLKKQDEEQFKKDVDNLTEVLAKIGEDDTPFEFEFFTGGKNEKFDELIRGTGLSSDSLEFLDFLQSDECNKILADNKLKIQIETGSIYHDNQDKNESILDFFFNEKNTIRGVIKFDLVYGGSYTDYFYWLIKDFNSHQKSKLDVLTNKNSKYLFYCYNDILQESNLEVKKN